MKPRGALASARPWALLALTFVVLLGAQLAAAPLARADPLYAYTFDANVTGWAVHQTGTVAWSGTAGHQTPGSLSLGRTSGSASAETWQTGTESLSGTYTLSAWVRATGSTASNVQLTFWDGNNNTSTDSGVSITVAQGWVQLYVTGSFGSTNPGSLGVYASLVNTSAKLLVDDVTISPGSSPQDPVTATPTPTPTPTATATPTPTATASTPAGSVSCSSPCSVVLDGSQFGLLFPLLFGGLTIVIVLLAIIAVRALT